MVEGFEWLKEKRNELEKQMVEKYPLLVYAVQIAVVIILLWTVWELTRQDYKSRAICSFFYEVQPQVNECKQPAFICADANQSSKFFKNFTSGLNQTLAAPGATPGIT